MVGNSSPSTTKKGGFIYNIRKLWNHKDNKHKRTNSAPNSPTLSRSRARSLTEDNNSTLFVTPAHNNPLLTSCPELTTSLSDTFTPTLNSPRQTEARSPHTQPLELNEKIVEVCEWELDVGSTFQNVSFFTYTPLLLHSYSFTGWGFGKPGEGP